MKPETSDLRQKAVYWPKIGYDRYGVAIVDPDAGIEIPVKWKNVTKHVMGKDGDPITINAEVKVDRVILVGSVMWEGARKDLPDPVTSLLRVVSIDEASDMRNRVTARLLRLTFISDRIPEA